MNKAQIVEALKSGKSVTVNIEAAKVVWVDGILKPISHYRTAYLTKIIVVDKDLGSIFFSGFSDKLRALDKGEKVSLKLTITGLGTPSEKYPDPIMFAKAHTRKGDCVKVESPDSDHDLTINV